MMQAVEPDAAAPAQGRRRRTWALVAALLGVVVGVGWWATHPDRFGPVGDQVGVSPAAVGEPLLFGVFPGASGAVDLHQATANVVENTAAADVSVVFCVRRPGQQLIGSARGAATDQCSAVLRSSDQQLAKDGTTDRQLVVAITPHRPGRVVVRGVRLSYRSGLRWGSETTGVVVDVTVP